MSLIYPGQHWPPEQDDLNYAKVHYAPETGRWALCQRTSACAWFTYHDTEEEALEAMQTFFEHCGITPAARAAQKLARRTRIKAQIARLEQELIELEAEP